TAATGVLIPIQCEYYALEGLSQLMRTVSLVQKHLNPKLEVFGALLTMFDGRTNLATQVVEEVRAFFKEKAFDTIVVRNVRLSEAPSHGQPIILYDPKSKGAEAYCDLAKEVINRE
ncbi:MAG: ParA family protein, partial [bacterium]|nr:ParA family protein [bacterium]